MSTVDPSATLSQLATVIEKAASDPSYRAALATSTQATLAAAGVSVPAGFDVQVVENSGDVRKLITYAKSSLSSEDLQQLEQLVAGAGTAKTAIESYAKLLIDSWADADLEVLLATDPAAALARYGISIPAGVSVETLVADASSSYLVLPAGELADSISSSFTNLTKLITAGSYIAGLGFSIGAIMKFKQHKDNPTQLPIGTPLALVLIAAAGLVR
jgi:intracellular multiplication protein IcmD